MVMELNADGQESLTLLNRGFSISFAWSQSGHGYLVNRVSTGLLLSLADRVLLITKLLIGVQTILKINHVIIHCKAYLQVNLKNTIFKITNETLMFDNFETTKRFILIYLYLSSKHTFFYLLQVVWGLKYSLYCSLLVLSRGSVM